VAVRHRPSIIIAFSKTERRYAEVQDNRFAAALLPTRPTRTKLAGSDCGFHRLRQYAHLDGMGIRAESAFGNCAAG
jgi:hypothetical protein